MPNKRKPKPKPKLNKRYDEGWPQDKRRSHAGSLFIVLGFVFFIAISISSVLVLQRSDKDNDTQGPVVQQTKEQAQTQAETQALAAAPANKPHPINLGNISINDTIIDDGTESETLELPPSVTITTSAKTPEDIPVVPSRSAQNKKAETMTTPESEIASLPPAVEVNKSSVPKASWVRPERPMIAIVLDDVGVNRRGAERAIGLPGAITLSFMTYASGVKEMTRAARDKGHELMLHVPMEPLGRADPGPQALLLGLSDEEILSRLEWGMARFDGYIGINNHMGSKFTGWDRGMSVVMQRIEKTDYFFMDSRTSPNSVAAETAASLGVPVLRRDTFIDNDYQDIQKIISQLELTEKIAQKNGHAIAIGHPHKTTVEALSQWIEAAEKRGFDVVPISAILALKNPAE